MFAWFQRLLPQKGDFFGMFEAHAATLVAAADAMGKLVDGGTPHKEHIAEIELRTVDVHIRRLRKAINHDGRADIIRTVRSAGYALDAEARL